ncbi:hypothetical protein GSB9_02753 [Flavobacteriaceae bacterium GSB9]|nr:hypothetical protein GSB9_02753 [Flavobacteriaceae bacterium GSB9]
MVRNKVKLNLGNPQNGWLPIEFESGEFELNFTTSKIPENPTDKMCDALILCLKGLESEFRWNVEPGIYFFKLSPSGDLVNLSISESDGSEVQNLIYEFNGDFNSVILPMYRSLKKFSTLEFEKTDWIKIDQSKLDKLTELVTNKKNCLQHRV